MTHSALSHSKNPYPNPAEQKLEQLLNPAHPLCKEDVVWILEFIKKKVAEEDPRLSDLSQPRLMQNFRYFAEISLMLIHRRSGFEFEADRLRDWMYEASFGLQPHKPNGKRKA
ncbi:hypothetical protein ACHHV8_10345 [Paenibacillus sp. TAB 01]|uniref:hypothetical protein n=1 Tax=Paenibacillus sp. TAB 01 TaxID=3368988 RepID=UPI00374FDE1C